MVEKRLPVFEKWFFNSQFGNQGVYGENSGEKK